MRMQLPVKRREHTGFTLRNKGRSVGYSMPRTTRAYMWHHVPNSDLLLLTRSILHCCTMQAARLPCPFLVPASMIFLGVQSVAEMRSYKVKCVSTPVAEQVRLKLNLGGTAFSRAWTRRVRKKMYISCSDSPIVLRTLCVEVRKIHAHIVASSNQTASHVDWTTMEPAFCFHSSLSLSQSAFYTLGCRGTTIVTTTCVVLS